MRLLHKQDIDTSKADERKREIDEAVKLARKIDFLRKTLADEEARLYRWRDETMKTILEEIQVQHNKLQEIKQQVADANKHI